MVVICEVAILSTGVIQDRVATPSTCTVQAPQSATPQPNFVPVMPSTSRSTQRRGVSPSTSTLWAFPLILMMKGMAASEMTFSQQIPTLMTGAASWLNVSVSTALGLILTLSEVFDVFDQRALILIAQVVAVVVALVLAEVRAGVDFEEPLHIVAASAARRTLNSFCCRKLRVRLVVKLCKRFISSEVSCLAIARPLP